MTKIPVTVSIDINSKASVIIEVEESVRGAYGSVEDRARDHVLAALAIGADLPWKVEHDLKAIGLVDKWKFDAQAPDLVEALQQIARIDPHWDAVRPVEIARAAIAKATTAEQNAPAPPASPTPEDNSEPGDDDESDRPMPQPRFTGRSI